VSSAGTYAEVRSNAGDPIQLSDLHPVACESLARFGSPDDGGYIVPLDAVTTSGALVSFGLAHNWRFERDFKKHNGAAIIHCYDHTVSLRTAFQYSVGQLLRFVARNRIASLRRAFAWMDYLVFFRTDRVHFKERVWHNKDNNSATIEDVFSRLPATQVFIKMDIEGSEYRILDDLLRHSEHITAMAIEFHDVDILSDHFNSLVRKIKHDFHIVHLHGNNMGGTTPFNFPLAPEITFLNKRFFKTAPLPSRLKYPVPGLDRPNDPRSPEFTFAF
jgi:hypothetical protein